jgi:hypothetical protein
VEPAVIRVLMHSQQPWTIAQHSLSPVVQVKHTPSLVISHLHMHIVRLQQHTIMPFIQQQQLQALPISDMHRFCSVLHAILSSQTQVIFMPPVHFSILILLQRGTIIVAMPGIIAGIGVPIPGMVAGIPIPVAIGFIIVVIMHTSP